MKNEDIKRIRKVKEILIVRFNYSKLSNSWFNFRIKPYSRFECIIKFEIINIILDSMIDISQNSILPI